MERHEPRRRALALALAMHSPIAPSVDVTWQAPAGCPDQAAARAEIVERLGDRPARDVRAVARVRALDEGAWQVEVELHTEEGTATRTLQAPSCAEALTATAVVLAIAVEPVQEQREPPQSPQAVPLPSDAVPAPPSEAETVGPRQPRQPRPSPTAEPSPVPEVEPAPRDAAPRSLGIAVGLRGGLDHGALPSPAAHAAASVGLWGQRWMVDAGPLHRLRTEASAALPQPAGGRFRLTAAQLRAGPRLRFGALEPTLAAGVELGAIWARGTGEVRPVEVRRLWTAAIASAGLGWAPVDALVLQLGLDGVVPLLRPTFTLGDEIEVLTVGPASIRAWLGVVGRFAL